MKMNQIFNILGLSLVIMFVGFVNADGNVGDSCIAPSDCSYPLACHNDICGENCYSHQECGRNRIDEFTDSYCGPLNTCLKGTWFFNIEPLTDDDVCPECDVSPYLCFGDPHDFFFDNLDNNGLYCGLKTDCAHLGITYHNQENILIYLPDKENLYICNGRWSYPSCANGAVWNVNKYGVGPFVRDSTFPPEDGCIPAPMPVPEFPLLLGAILMLLNPGFAYLVLKR